MSSAKGQLEDQVVLVTGGARGLGRAIVDRFVLEGASIGVLDQSADALKDVAKKHGSKVVTICGDVRTSESNLEAVELCVERFKRLDCAIANAGIWDYSLALVDHEFERLDAAFDEIFQVNVKGRCCLPKPRSRSSSGAKVVFWSRFRTPDSTQTEAAPCIPPANMRSLDWCANSHSSSHQLFV